MRFFNALVHIFQTVLVLLIGLFFVAISLNIITSNNITDVVSLFYMDENLRLSLGISGLLLIIIGLAVAQLACDRAQRERTIAFENPEGEVTISLSAIEDFIKRIFVDNAEIKELKPACVAGKKGIEVSSKVSLWQDVKIPEITEKIQTVIKSKLQQLLGIDESISVKVHVIKIIAKEPRKPKTKDERENSIEIPYQY